MEFGRAAEREKRGRGRRSGVDEREMGKDDGLHDVVACWVFLLTVCVNS